MVVYPPTNTGLFRWKYFLFRVFCALLICRCFTSHSISTSLVVENGPLFLSLLLYSSLFHYFSSREYRLIWVNWIFSNFSPTFLQFFSNFSTICYFLLLSPFFSLSAVYPRRSPFSRIGYIDIYQRGRLKSIFAHGPQILHKYAPNACDANPTATDYDYDNVSQMNTSDKKKQAKMCDILIIIFGSDRFPLLWPPMRLWV